MGETRVDLQHLLEDLRDAYSGPIEETIVTEMVANALDAGASTIAISVHPDIPAITIVDDGRGMERRELRRYHDIASSTKRRGEGIGFAGVGMKLGLLVSREVTTETRRGATHAASQWQLASRYRAPWKWVPPPGLAVARGTAVRLTLTTPLSPLLDAAFIEHAIRQHFEPLLEPRFGDLLARHYRHPVTVHVDGQRLVSPPLDAIDVVPLSIRLARKRTPSALGYLARYDHPLPDERAGLAISTFGKVIKRGWDWLGLSPAAADRVTGLIEVPALAECLTLNKNDFFRAGARGATFLAYRKALQEVVQRQLTLWGEASPGAAPPRAPRIDRDLERVLEDLSDDFPLLHSLVERRRGGQKRLPTIDGRGDNASPPMAALEAEVDAEAAEPHEPSSPPPESPPADANETAPERPLEGASVGGVTGPRRRAHYGLAVRFESRPDDLELARLVDNTVWVNDRHPAFARAATSRALAYHLALSVALALAPLAVTPAEEHRFVTRFLAEWGTVSGRAGRVGRRRGRRRGSINCNTSSS